MLNLSISVRAIFFIFILAGASACQAGDKVRIETPAGERQAFSISVAQTPEEHQKGLMFVEAMPENQGMIFLYDNPEFVRYWMKNTLIPLDMLFFDDTNTLIHIEHNVMPGDERLRGPNGKVCSVLELNGGTVKKQGIVIGSKLLSDLTQECLQSSIN